jgi:hypothetical protein
VLADPGSLKYSSERIADYIKVSARILESADVPTRAIKDRVTKLAMLMQLILSNVEQFQPETADQKKYAGAALQSIGEARKIMEAIQNLAVIDED